MRIFTHQDKQIADFYQVNKQASIRHFCLPHSFVSYEVYIFSLFDLFR